MPILNRISTILRADINDLLDHAEDPEKTLNQYIRDLSDALREARTQTADAIAQVRLTEADLQQANQLVAQWQGRAEQAVGQGADDLARESLRRKHDYERNVQVYEQQLAAQQNTANTLKGDLALLESKYAEADRDRQMMLARYRGAQAQEAVQQSLAAFSNNDPDNALERMDEKIRMTEARAAAARELGTSSLEGRLAGLDRSGADTEIEAELQQLKSRTGLPAPKPAEASSTKASDNKPNEA